MTEGFTLYTQYWVYVTSLAKETYDNKKRRITLAKETYDNKKRRITTCIPTRDVTYTLYWVYNRSYDKLNWLYNVKR